MEWLRDLGILPIVGFVAAVGVCTVLLQNRRKRYRRAADRLRLLGIPQPRIPFLLAKTNDTQLDLFLRSHEPPVALGRMLDGLGHRGSWTDGESLSVFLFGTDEARQRHEHHAESPRDVRVLQPLELELEDGSGRIEILVLWIRGHRLLALQTSRGKLRKGTIVKWRRDDRYEHASVDSLDSQSTRVLWISCRKGMSWEERRAEYRTRVQLGAFLLPGALVRDVLARHLGSHDETNRHRARVDLAGLVEDHGVHVEVRDISRSGARLALRDEVELEGRDFWLGLVPTWEQDLAEVLVPTRLLRRDRDGTFGFRFGGLTRETVHSLTQWIVALQRMERASLASKIFQPESRDGA